MMSTSLIWKLFHMVVVGTLSMMRYREWYQVRDCKWGTRRKGRTNDDDDAVVVDNRDA